VIFCVPESYVAEPLCEKEGGVIVQLPHGSYRVFIGASSEGRGGSNGLVGKRTGCRDALHHGLPCGPLETLGSQNL
jgi:hypothetical protein